ncbi:diaminobutyrate acetyltransferase [Streptomyces coelicoflavus]|uniref:L-2,4-diaminobutyric acid acetyltransferase n=1 Tax=Streptomyces coelicoflavus TaxID=285562 RepID=A0A6N9USU2_9ACTN|nr:MULTISPECIES: diaminobutyrate acetyltransferase [Streptomyces]EHN73794.1 acetyltransferase [Streptomyces coelicoflavus ZG0656]KPC74166.1 L-2,4-diaminobutyric acid acetyltransferase [Streptomyces sp. NRRL WC-3753]MZE44605.1 diaminobutyrate acetyltransferase [Streptomyces sp. SID5477]NEB20785.1 diaminobutyrate acetyltransferase [Streptomyces coelicoflavus]OWA07205.1 L-2,4-diaminobutyric acid acetyltransferase [Streptomyces sp. CS159]
MTAAQADLQIDRPRVADGAALWRIARDSEVLDLNSSYSYLLWCRDFAATSAVVRDGHGVPVGFITGYVRPDSPDTLLVWQVAVDGTYRGRGLAATLVDGLAERVARERGITILETTISPDNTASQRLFTSFAERRGARLEREVLFDTAVFPDGPHEPEVLYRIGPLSAGG